MLYDTEGQYHFLTPVTTNYTGSSLLRPLKEKGGTLRAAFSLVAFYSALVLGSDLERKRLAAIPKVREAISARCLPIPLAHNTGQVVC